MSQNSSADTRSKSPSISSRNFVIPEDEFSTLDTENSSQDSVDAEDIEGCDSDNNVRFSTNNHQEGHIQHEINQDGLLPEVPHNNSFFTDNHIAPLFDTSKYLFESLSQALSSVDFSEAISLQTKTSAIVNSTSRKLNVLIVETQNKLKYFTEVFERGAATSQRIKTNLQAISKNLEKLKTVIAKDYPIEYNQSIAKFYGDMFE